MKQTLFSATVALAAALSAPALAERATILVIDESGSMWAQLPEGRSRIEVAREVLSDYLTDRDPTQPLGVIAYGHNRKGDCADIEVIAPVAPNDGAALAARLRGLMPQGKTPLAEALRLAGQSIPRTAEEADIVLITDGLESCGGDPCAVAAELRSQGIPVRAHVVGFGLTEGEIQQIACVAETTGGQVLLAQSGDDLAGALTTVDLPPAMVALSLRPIDATTGAVLSGVDWVLSAADDREQDRASGLGTWAVDVPPGSYQVVATAPAHAGGLSLDVTAQTGGVIDVPLEPTQARLDLIARDEETGKELTDVTWILTGENGAETAIDSGAGSVLLPPGTYRITGRSGERVGTAERAVALGKQTIEVVFPVPLREATLDAGAKAVAGARIGVAWTGPDDRQDFIIAVPAGAPDTEEGNLARTAKGSPAALKLPDATGAFELRYVHAATGKILARRPITLTEPEASLMAPDTSMAGARIAVEWLGPDNQNDFVTVVAAGAPDAVEGNLARTYRGNPAELLLPDALGAHELRYVVAQSGRVLARRPITLIEAVATLSDPGPILPGGRFKLSWEGPDNQNDFVTIVPQGAPEDEQGNLARTYRGSPAELKAPDVPGAYELRYVLAQSGRVLAVLPVTVGAGAVSLAVEGTAQAGQSLRVTWSGPGRYEDAIEILPVGSAADAVALRSARASQGNPAVLQALPSPGTYLLRYRATDSGEVLNQIEVEVSE